MDVCVITYRNTADRIRTAVRERDRLWVRDNTHDNIGFARAANELAAKGDDPLILFVNPDGDPQPGCFDLLEACLADPGVVAAEASQGPNWANKWDAERYTWLSGACLMVRRAAFEKIGGFDPTLFLYVEDTDLSWRLAELGRLVHCETAQFSHDRSGQSFRATFWETRNTFRVHRRWGRPRNVSLMLRAVLGNIRDGRWRLGAGRLAGLVAYGCLDRRRP